MGTDLQPSVQASPISAEGETSNALLRRAAAAIAEWKDPSGKFHHEIAWASDYDALFERRWQGSAEVATIANRALGTGRVLLFGSAGSGKSVMLRNLDKALLNRSWLPIYVNLERWSASETVQWSAAQSSLQRLDYLLANHSAPVTSFLELSKIPRTPKLLIIDSLNEVSTGITDSLLDAADTFASYLVGSGVIVADRLVRRTMRNIERWQLAAMLPLSLEEVRKRLEYCGKNLPASERSVELLRLPFFLDAFIRDSHIRATYSENIEDYFRTVVGLSDKEIDTLAEAAFEAYRESASRAFRRGQFEQVIGPVVTQKLQATGTLGSIPDPQSGEALWYFDHQLKHDYLTARYAARSADRWTYQVFDALTFSAASFDVLALVAEQLEGDEIDEFLRQLYDWNQYGAAYVLAEGYRRELVMGSIELTYVILAMLAEKRWDIIESTASRAKDALYDFPGELPSPFRKANTLDDVLDLIASLDSRSNWFSEWQRYFVLRPEDSVPTSSLDSLAASSSIVGWTLANVLKRVKLSRLQIRTLRSSTNSASLVERWRAVHVLGAWPSELTLGTLLNVYDRERDGWVKYGAIRSIIELAARSGRALRKKALRALEARADSILRSNRVRTEFARAVFIREDWLAERDRSVDEWIADILPVMRAVYARSLPDDRQYWLELMYDLDARREEANV